MWVEACERAKLPKSDCGYLLFQKLKDIEKDNIGNKLVAEAQLGVVNVFSEDAVDQILTVLDKRFKEDDLALKKKAWKTFVYLKREKGQTIDEYIDKFDNACSNLKIAGRDLDDETYALQLMESASLTDELSQLVISGINDKQPDILDQTKRSLRKYLGSDKSGLAVAENPKVKDEIFYPAEEDEAYIASRNFPNRGRGFNRGYGRSRASRGRGYHKFPPKNSKQLQQQPAGSSNAHGQEAKSVRQRQVNPVDENGLPQRCNICGSIFHFAGKYGHGCPESYHNIQNAYQTDNEEAQKCDASVENEVFVIESSDECLLDSCCTSNVMGLNWKESFFTNLSHADLTETKIVASNSKFKFGGEIPIKAIEKVTFPCYILGKRTTITADVVNRDIPLLLSKSEMKRRGFSIDFNNDTLKVDGQSYVLETTASGHFKLPVWRDDEVNICVDDMNDAEKLEMVTKLHRQFRHQPANATEDLLRKADILTPQLKQMNSQVAKDCDVCKRYKRTPPRPVVSLPMASYFNEKVTLDLKVYSQGKIYFIYFIDLFTRFTRAKVIKSKEPKVVVDAFILTWISAGMGAPKKVLIDNGGEFDNPQFIEAMEQFGVEICATGAASPWSNGICERNHAVVDLMVLKMLEENPEMKIDVALANAVNAKNCLQNHKGFSPVQLVTGALPNLPNAITSALPALESPENENLNDHLNAIHLARQAYIKVESAERVKRALQHRVRACEETFVQGDKIYYKRNDSPRWRGRGKVLGQLGTIVYVIHGSRLVRCPSCRVIKTSQAEPVDVDISTLPEKNRSSLDGIPKQIAVDSTSEDSGESADETDQDEAETTIQEISTESPSDCRSETNDRPKRHRKPPLQYEPESGKWYSNSPDANDEANVVMIPNQCHNDTDVIEAKRAEIENWQLMEAVDLVDDKGQKVISTRWVVTEKEQENGIMKPKARLVIRGFKEDENVQVDAPTASRTTLRTVFAIASQNDWPIQTIDIKAAFLQGRLINRDVFVVPPPEANVTGKLWRLRKTAYGLNDAARNWYLLVRETLFNLGCIHSQLDKAVFRWYHDDVLQGIILLHVDDFFVTGTTMFFKQIVQNVKEAFKVGKCISHSFKYVGLQITKSSSGIVVNQDDYASEINDRNLQTDEFHQDVISKNQLRNLRSLIGQLQWVSSQTRPDLCFDTLELSIERNKATASTLKRAKKVIKKLHGRKSEVVFKNVGEIEKIIAYPDAGFCNLPDGMSSTQGYVIFLAGSKGTCILDWGSLKIKRKVASTLEAETLALKETINNAIYLGSLLSEFLFNDFKKTVLKLKPFVITNQPSNVYDQQNKYKKNA